MPRAALIAAAREGAGGVAGGVALPVAGGDVASVAGDGDPLPPQEATPAISIAMASRRTVDAALNALDISLPFLLLIRHAGTCCPALDLVRQTGPPLRHNAQRAGQGTSGENAVRVLHAVRAMRSAAHELIMQVTDHCLISMRGSRRMTRSRQKDRVVTDSS
jgi:hypothetical protein